MNYSYYFLICLIVCTSCNPDKDKIIDLNKLSFNTTDASEIYFKNVRASYYDEEDKKEMGIIIYRLKNWEEQNVQPAIRLSIVYNWRNDNAFVMTHPNTQFPEVSRILAGNDTIIFAQNNMKDQLNSLSIIFNAIVQEKPLHIETNNNWVSFLDNPQDRENFKITMYDFYRLTESF